ncbi:uncharacterized protein [Haliotis asinina]|uniref:uncharacterized protein n=1 Tax=Haliotis asinina TaxID=109174 RepID=UPI003531D665
MDTVPLQSLFFLTSLLQSWTIVNSNTVWDHLSLKYGLWYRPPRTPVEAMQAGYIKMNHICKMDTYHGFLYMQEGNYISRLIFDLNDNLAGIQTAIPGNMEGFNSRNETIKLPPSEVMPPILLSQEQNYKGTQMYMITAYFKHPSLICSPYAYNAHPGKGLYIQMGYRVEHEYERIPLEAHHLSYEWKRGNCIPKMGLHYFKNLSKNMPCERLYPVFLMYNTEGQLGAFGWIFQGEPITQSSMEELRWFKLTPTVYPFTFDTNMLPSCMFNKEFSVFGIHIWLRNEDKMLCPLPTVMPQTKRPPTTYKPKKTRPTENNIILDKIIRDREEQSGSAASSVTGDSLIFKITFCLSALFMRCVRNFFSIPSPTACDS